MTRKTMRILVGGLALATAILGACLLVPEKVPENEDVKATKPREDAIQSCPPICSGLCSCHVNSGMQVWLTAAKVVNGTRTPLNYISTDELRGAMIFGDICVGDTMAIIGNITNPFALCPTCDEPHTPPAPANPWYQAKIKTVSLEIQYSANEASTNWPYIEPGMDVPGVREDFPPRSAPSGCNYSIWNLHQNNIFPRPGDPGNPPISPAWQTCDLWLPGLIRPDRWVIGVERCAQGGASGDQCPVETCYDPPAWRERWPGQNKKTNGCFDANLEMIEWWIKIRADVDPNDGYFDVQLICPTRASTEPHVRSGSDDGFGGLNCSGGAIAACNNPQNVTAPGVEKGATPIIEVCPNEGSSILSRHEGVADDDDCDVGGNEGVCLGGIQRTWHLRVRRCSGGGGGHQELEKATLDLDEVNRRVLLHEQGKRVSTLWHNRKNLLR